jgi:hypothetical protein
MKIHILTTLGFLVLASPATILAQGTSNAKDEMKKLSAWVGHWTGTSTAQKQGGRTEPATVDERIEWKVDGHALLINGLGKGTDGRVVHEALGVLSFDATENRYRLRTWIRDGKTADAWFTIVAENNFQWGMDVPSGRIRYSIQLTATTWTEIGEFSPDGSQWYPFLHMNLTRQAE